MSREIARLASGGIFSVFFSAITLARQAFTRLCCGVVIRHAPIVTRVRGNVERLMKAPGRPKVTRKQIAGVLGLSVSQVGNFIRGAYGISLKHLDPLAEVLGVPTSELVRASELPLFELTEAESRLMLYYRGWTPAARESLLHVLDFLHGRLPSDQQSTQMFDYWNRLGHHERNIVFANAVRLTDEGLSPELRARLGIPATDDEQARRGGKRRRP